MLVSLDSILTQFIISILIPIPIPIPISPPAMDSLSRQRTGLDRLSALPEEVLGKIISLIPYQEAVKTSVLSTPWRYVWRLVSDLEFNDWCLNRSRYEPNRVWWFLVSINRAMMHREAPIWRFHLTCRHPCNNSFLTGWINAAVSSGVRDVNLNLNPECIHPMPSTLFACETLTTLNLMGGIQIDLRNQAILLPNLKNLRLDRIRFTGFGSIERILSGCPVLEDFDIRRRCDDEELVLHINVPTLKMLSYTFYKCEHACTEHNHAQSSEDEEEAEEEEEIDVDGDGESNYDEDEEEEEEEEEEDDSEYKLIISTPNLEDLYLKDWVTDKYIVNDVVWPWLDEAYVNVRRDICVQRLLKAISSSKCIGLASSTLGCLSHEGVLPRFPNLKKLELGISEACLQFVNEFLERSPSLEILVFEKEYENYRYTNPCWITPFLVPMCLTRNLKEIMFESFSGDEYEVDLVEYFLKYGRVLNLVTLQCPKYVSFDVRFMIEEFPRQCELKILH